MHRENIAKRSTKEFEWKGMYIYLIGMNFV